MKSLEIKTENQEENGILMFNHSQNNNKICLIYESENDQFQIKNIQENKENILMSIDQNNINFNSDTTKFNSLIFEQDITFNNIKQWKLYIQEQYHKTPSGWTQNDISFCGGINMLGGFGILAGGEIQKEFENLPEHNQIRITANYHFIDAWSGETGFMRVNMGAKNQLEYTWTQQYDFSKSIESINVCGAHYGEGMFSKHIDVQFQHVQDSIILSFGSTLDDDALENSFGISNLEIYLI